MTNFTTKIKLPSTENFEEPIKELGKDINILLLGETGVGKSTFINGFSNYLTYEDLEEAKKEPITLIPTSFTITDENFQQRTVSLGSDGNEEISPNKSSTQSCKSYKFDFGKYIIRLIDTPGIGDTRGIEQDKKNLENMLQFIANFNELHCICILLKPNNAKITATFEFCIKQLLSHLDKSASENIVFIFTNARGTFYRPGDTASPLQEILRNIEESPPFVKIPFIKKTVYCLDNEPFRFLVATLNDIGFNEDEEENFAKSWKTSAKECSRLIGHIIGVDDEDGINPHKVLDTISVNEARRQIISLRRPLAEIIENNEENIKIAETRRKELEENSNNIEFLKKNIFIPFVDIEIKNLPNNKLVCENAKCCQVYEVYGYRKLHYKIDCHNPCNCSLTGINNYWCSAIDRAGNCTACGCKSSEHTHIKYDSIIVEKRHLHESNYEQLQTTQEIKAKVEMIKRDIDDRVFKIQEEVKFITTASAKFANFLKNNAIAPFNDSFESYIEKLIENAKIASNDDIVIRFEGMLKNYKSEKQILEDAFKDNSSESVISTEDIFNLIQNLYQLEINGNKIRESQLAQSSGQKSEVFSSSREIYYNPKKKNFISSAFHWTLKKIGLEPSH